MGRLFGTNGVRGFANRDMNVDLATDLGRALGSFLPEGSVIAIGTDTRTSSSMLKSALAAGLLSTGVAVRDAGVVPTPALQYAVKTDPGLAAAAIVTASHNPPEFNGIKFIDGDGTEFPSSKEDAVEDVYFAKKWREADWRDLSAADPLPGVNERYVSAILAKADRDAVARRRLKVVLDTSNGAGGLTAPFLLRRLGVDVITLNAQPDGTFPGHPSEPTPENVKDLVTAVTAFGADLGVVQDGDADRCVFVDGDGRYVPGDRTLALVAGQVVAQQRGGTAARSQAEGSRDATEGSVPTVVTPVSSSSCVEDYVKSKGGKVVYTRVGAPIVARKMIEIGAAFGGEENGGLIFPEHQHCRDASMTLARVLEIVARAGKPFADLVDEVPVYHVHKLKVSCPNEKKAKALDAFAAAHKGDKVDRTDGVKVIADGGWVLVRPSGTEPIFRVYAEAKEAKKAREMGEAARGEIEEIIGRV